MRSKNKLKTNEPTSDSAQFVDDSDDVVVNILHSFFNDREQKKTDQVQALIS